MISSTNIRNNIIPLLLIILVSGVVIFYRFPEIPQHLSFDEVEFARLALSLKESPYVPYSPIATGHATLYFYILLSSLNILGVTTFALRLPAALFGIANAILFFALMKEAFLNRSWPASKLLRSHLWLFPLLLSLLFVTSRWYFNFARFSFEATFLLFLELLSLFFFLIYRKKQSLLFLGLSGAFAGLAFNSYTPGRLFFIGILFFLLYEMGKKRPLRTQIAMPFLAFIMPFMILITPLAGYLFTNTDLRVQELSYIENKTLSPGIKLGLLGENIRKTAGMFHIKGDLNGRHNYPGKPALNPIMGLLFLIGLGITIKKGKQFYNALFLTYFLISLIPVLLTYPAENPHMLRTFTVLPAVVFFIGNTLFFLIHKLPPKYILMGLFILLFLSALYELRTYFVYQTTVFPEAFELEKPLELHLEYRNSL